MSYINKRMSLPRGSKVGLVVTHFDILFGVTKFLFDEIDILFRTILFRVKGLNIV